MSAEDRFDWLQPDYSPIWEERARRLERIRAPGYNLAALRAWYRDHPCDFVNDWCVTYDPRLVDRGVEPMVPFLLFPKQEEFIDWVVDRWKCRQDGIVEKSRDMGVSWLCIALAVWWWLFYPGIAIGFGSRKEVYVDELGDPKSLFWKARKLIELLPAELTPKGFRLERDAPFMRIVNPDGGGSITGEAGDNIGRGARAAVYFVDEAAYLERPESVDAALSQTTNCRIEVSTPNGEGNPFYRRRHGGKVPVFVFDWRDDPRKGKDWYRSQVEKLDPVVLAQEVDRDYSASVGNSWISSDMVTEAMQRGPLDVHPAGGLRAGVDVARFGDDRTVLSLRRGRALLRQVEWNKADTEATAGRVRQELLAFKEQPEQIAVDAIGIGAGVADKLRAWWPDRKGTDGKVRRIVQDVNAALRMGNGQDYNLRAFMYRELKAWLTTASIPNDQDLRVDLTAMRYGFRGGELLLESKDDAKKRGVRSPDRADSLALTFAYPTIPDARPALPPSAYTSYQPADAAVGL